MNDLSPIDTDGYQVYWDATALAAFRECEKKYEYSILRGLRSKDESVHLTFGKFYTEALESYYYRVTVGDSHESALADVVLLTLVKSKEWYSDHPSKNRFCLVRTIIFYLEEFEHDPAETVILSTGVPAVEVPFSFRLNDRIVLTGRLDRIVRLNGEVFISDHKTTGTSPGPHYFAQWSPNPQMSLYSIAGQIILGSPIAGVILNVAHVGAGFSRFHRGMIYRSKEQNEEWLEDLEYWLDAATRAVQRKHWKMNDTSCHKYSGCQFRGLCSRAPSVREIFINTDFEVRPWNSLTTSEDSTSLAISA
jgi:PD-(D/E)XK nuclease superfamily